MNKTIFATILETDSEVSIYHSERGKVGLANCQAYAQRLTETNQGTARVGTVVPLTKQEQIEIAKSKKLESGHAASHSYTEENSG